MSKVKVLLKTQRPAFIFHRLILDDGRDYKFQWDTNLSIDETLLTIYLKFRGVMNHKESDELLNIYKERQANKLNKLSELNKIKGLQ